MSQSFYSSLEYKKKQSKITKTNWKKGLYKHRIKPIGLRHCKNPNCINTFKTKPWDQKMFCTSKCSAIFNNTGRKQTITTRQRISKSVSLLPKRIFMKRKTRILLSCKACGKNFKVVPYLSKTRKYCSNLCAITTIGKQTTSAKASKGKFGIRKDIDSTICFYSTWEANMARVFNLINLKWQYAPQIFNLGTHTYRPDFYLPDFDTYIEVKNYLGPYSLQRDHLFRQKYPNIKLDLLLKKHYLEIKSNYKDLIDAWE
jgi:hypothetical protein